MESRKSYEELEDHEVEADKPLMGEKGRGDWRHRRSTHLPLWTTLMLHGVLIAISGSLALMGLHRHETTDKQCSSQLGAHSTAYDAIEYMDIRFQGAILDENPWKGHPDTLKDKAWNVITNQDQFAINEEDMELLKKPLTQVKWPDEVGGGYMASLEVFHQLHCLNSLRQYTYKDYYSTFEEKPFWFKFGNETMRGHLDHCIDILRQSLMCHGDVGIVTYSWVKGHSIPYPDFSSWHKCRNNVPLVQYHRNHRVKVQKMEPNEDDTVLEKPPCERAYNDIDPELAPDVCP